MQTRQGKVHLETKILQDVTGKEQPHPSAEKKGDAEEELQSIGEKKFTSGQKRSKAPVSLEEKIEN